MKKKVTIAAYLAGVTTLAVSLPAMAETLGEMDLKDETSLSQTANTTLPKQKGG